MRISTDFEAQRLRNAVLFLCHGDDASDDEHDVQNFPGTAMYATCAHGQGQHRRVSHHFAAAIHTLRGKTAR
jgi:hypothetical protein